MIRKTISITSALAIILIVSILLPAPAAAVPQPPHVFRGAVTVGGSAAADGLTVTAAIAGASFPYTLTAQTSGGRYGDDLQFKVPADDPDTSTKEGGVDGDTILFYVQGVEAGTHAFTVGGVTQLDLSISALPTLAAPTNIQRTTPNNDNTPTFTWNAVTNAASYEVRIVGVTTFTNIGNVTTYTFTTIADGSHSFEIRGVDAQSTPGPSSLSSFTIDTTPPSPPPAAGGGGGGGGGGGLAGVTSVLYSVAADGRFTEDVTAESGDGNVELFIPKNTIGKNRMGSLLSTITIKEEEEAFLLPAMSKIIGRIYNLGPSGATFDPPITLTFKYDVSLIPQGVAEKNLVMVTWDNTASKWVEMESTVDPENDTIAVKVNHFSVFTILAHTRPASFTVADLSVTPGEVNLGEDVSISVLITNAGDLTGSYEVNLKIDNVVAQTKEVILDGGDSETISFSVTSDTAGEHTVNIDSLLGTFMVEAPKAPVAFTTSALTISPAEVNIGERLAISVTVTNTGDLTGAHKVTLKINGAAVEAKEVSLARGASQKVVFTIAKDTAGTYTVDVDGLSGSFLVKEKIPLAPPSVPPPAPAPPEIPPVTPVNWWLIGGIMAAVIVIGVVAWFVAASRRG